MLNFKLFLKFINWKLDVPEASKLFCQFFHSKEMESAKIHNTPMPFFCVAASSWTVKNNNSLKSL